MHTPLFDYIERLQSCPSIDTAWAAIREFAKQHGMPRIGCCYGSLRLDKPMSKPFVRGTFKAAIGKRWSKEEIFRLDGVVTRALSSPTPFCWGADFLDRSSTHPDVLSFYQALGDDGARSMLVIPMRCDRARGLGLGMVGNDMPRKEFQAFITEHGALLTAAVLYADMRMVMLSRADRTADNQLAPRETECLQLLTSGLKNELIAARMGITVHTVQIHLASAKRKLGAATREQALAKAVMFRIIRPEGGSRPKI